MTSYADQSKHFEFQGNNFHGIVNFDGGGGNHTRGDRAMLRKRDKIFDTLGSETGKSTFLGLLSQSNHTSKIPPICPTDPKFNWILKNIDFKQWELPDGPPVLWLLGPPDHGMTEVSSHIVGEEKKKARNVFYLFCSTIEKDSLVTIFAHSILHHILNNSGDDQAKTIVNIFVRTLLYAILRRDSHFQEEDSPRRTMDKIIDAAQGHEPLEALRQAISGIEEISEMSIIIDGIDKLEHEGVRFLEILCQHMKIINPKFKALLAYQLDRNEEIVVTPPCIEYDKERQECLRSLYYKNDDQRHDKISKEHSSSLSWLWAHEKYRAWWESESSSILFIEGKPGSGKSTLAKYFKQKLEENDNSGIVAHYFYTFRESELETTHRNMLRSILHRILEQDEHFFVHHFQEEFRSGQPRNHEQWLYDSLKRILLSFADHPVKKRLYLILDALDESEENDRRDIVDLLCRLCSKTRFCDLKIFLTSRPIPQLQRHIQDHYHVISLQEENGPDIAKFVDDFLTPDLGLSKKTLDQVKDHITTHAQGVFIWVSLVIKELLDYIDDFGDKNHITSFLKKVPVELREFYKFTLDRVQSSKIVDTRKIFQFVLFARRPLTVVEVYHATIIPEHDSAVDSIILPSDEKFQENTFDDMTKRILYMGRNMLETRGVGADKTLQVIHETVREFFLKSKPDEASSDGVAADIVMRGAEAGVDSHITIAIACIRYMKFCFTNRRIQATYPEIGDWASQNFEDYVNYLDRWSFINYALENLKEHMDACGRDRVSQLFSIISRQLADNPYPRFWGDWMASRFEEYDQVSVRSRHDFIRGAARALRIGGSVPNGRHQTYPEDLKYELLNTAARIGPLRVASVLLTTCTIDNQGKTPMIISAAKGHDASVQLLIDLGEDKEAADGSGQRALHHAAKNGHEAVVRLLIQNGAEKRVKDNKGRTALRLAVLKWQVPRFFSIIMSF
ncbi:hypothetical protein BDD12DRAFT_890425 [Trichophaea hybrida]|nr:hypothetical protein BDD12DRAFT_890425 [Trichophaea hybrida]